MAKLTTDQISFLKAMQVPLYRTFDATGMSASEYREVMKPLGLWIAYGVKACKKAGHTLRDRTGHCVQCDTKSIAYLRRHDESGGVYIVHSRNTGLIKIGTSQKALDRTDSLNVFGYGGVTDWKRQFFIECERAGKVEAEAHKLLSDYSATAQYVLNGKRVEASELFRCSVEQAIDTVKQANELINETV